MYYGTYDGACNPNPGPMGIGCSITDSHGNEVATSYAGKGAGTNNEAEYHALIEALRLAQQHGIRNLTLRGDSKIVTNQVNGIYQCKKKELIDLRDQVAELAKGFDRIKFEWIPREKNKRADQLSKQGLSEVKPANNEVKERKPKFDTPDYTITPFPGLGFALSDGKRIYAVNMNPILCSCEYFSKETLCQHIHHLKKLARTANQTNKKKAA